MVADQRALANPAPRRANIFLFGEIGNSKNSIINLILGPYDVTIQGRDFRIFETVGWNKPNLFGDPELLVDSISKAYRLIKYLSETGGINLLVFCIQRGKITDGMRANYKLFNDFLCHKKVPVVLVVTDLEHEESMEDWWLGNHIYFRAFRINVAGHACITANRQFPDRYQASRQVVHDLLVTHSREIGFAQEGLSWVTVLFQESLDFLGFRPRFDSLRGSWKKLGEHGLREDEIIALLGEIGTVNEDTDLAISVSRDEALKVDHERRFPYDLTSQVIREGHNPVASGGFADIYRGMLQSDAKSIRRLRREVRVWLNLEHDNVLQLLGTTMGISRFPAMLRSFACSTTLLLAYSTYIHVLLCRETYQSNILINENGCASITDFGLSTLLAELGGLAFATSFHARGTIRWMAPELLDLSTPENEPEDVASCISPTTHNDVYAFGGVMLQILDGKVPYHYYPNDMRVVHAVLKGMTATRPSNALVADCRWTFIQQCWSTVDIPRSCPTCDEIVDFTKNELPCVGTS